jgi:hypothetical protein
VSNNRIHNADKGMRNGFTPHCNKPSVLVEQDGIFYCSIGAGTDEKGRIVSPVPLRSGDKRPPPGDSPLVASIPPHQDFIDNPETFIGRE